MPSMFYTAAFERRFPLTFLFLEDIGITTSELNENSNEEDVELAIRRSLKRCYKDMKVTAADVAYVSERLEKAAAEKEKRAAELADQTGSGKKKQSFASSYADWAAKLEPHEACLAAANMDYFKARRLYCEVDKDDVTEMSAQWMKMEWEKIKVGYESVVYGFGGGYKEGASLGDTEVDVSTDDNAKGKAINKAALNAVKF